MATSFESTPTWFNAEYYIGVKLAQLLADDPNGGWTRETMLKAFADNGFDNTYDHYLAYGDKEGLSPNVLFNNTEYLTAKAAQMGSSWTAEMVAKAIQDAGMTLMEHYERYGSAEGLNPSSAFNQDKYFDAKLDQLQLAEPDKGWTMETLKEAFANAGLTPLDHFLMFSKDEGLDKFDYSENGAPIPHPGNTSIVLTTGVDTVTPDSTETSLKTSDRDDVISAVVSSVSSKGTLNAGDVIDGGKGVDTLKVDMQGSFGGFTKGGSVKSVEKIVLENAGGATFDAKGVEGAELYTLNIGAKTSTIKNVDTVATEVSLTADKGATFNLQFADAAVAGKEDNATVILAGVGEAGGSVNLKVGATSTGKVETLTLDSTGKGNFVNVQSAHDALVVTGEADLDVLDAIAGLKSFDASAALGDVKADLKSSSDTLKAIKGGLGDDTITLSKLASGAVLDGGEGKDTLKLEGITDGVTIKNSISDVETFSFKEGSAAHAANTIDLSKVTGLNTVVYEGVTKQAGGATTAGGLYHDEFIIKNSTLSDFTFMIKDNASGGAGDPGTATKLTYDGTGALNLTLDGEGAGNVYSAIGFLTAKNINTLNISAPNDETSLAVWNITANAVETMNIDSTGATSIAVSTEFDNHGKIGSGVGGSMAALNEIVIKGDGGVAFGANGTEKALTTVEAAELTGNLMLDLHALSAGTSGAGVTINVGTGGSLLAGTKGNDIITLGKGEDTVVFAADLANNGKDTIANFGSDDHLNVAALGVSGSDTLIHVAATSSKVTVAAEHAVVIDNGGVAFGISSSTVKISDYTDTNQVAAFLNVGVTVTASKQNVFVINDVASNATYVYQLTNDTTAAIAGNELSLVGTITDNGALDTGNLVFA